MANPSLQIGNDNWAIKEDNLLGYSTAGTRFVPQPITMTRATLGTRVNPSGLVEDVELLGSELVTNGDFDTDSDWTKVNSTISSGKATVTVVGGANSYITQTLSYTSGQKYKLTATINGTSGKEIKFQDRGNNSGGLTTTNGTVTLDGSDQNIEIYWIANSNSDGIVIARSTTSGDYIFTIDNVSVKEATIDNLPRVDYTDGTSSLLVEPQRTNLLTYSEDFSDSSWINTYTITPNSIISPDGTLNAYKITLGTGNGSLRTLNSVSSNTDYVFSFYAKRGTASEMKYRVFDFTIPFADIIPKTSYYSQTNTDSWVRIEVPFTTGASTTSIGCYIDSDSQGDGDFYVWGAQLEAGSYATSYIKTSGSTVTRNQETYKKTGISNLINSEEGVLFVEMASLNSDTSSIIISINDGSLSNSVAIYYYSNVNNVASNIFNGGNNPSLIGTIPNSGTKYDFNKIALKYKSGDSALWINGIEVFTLGDSISLTGLNEISFDYGNGSFPFYGKVKQLQVFKTALSDSELAALTS